MKAYCELWKQSYAIFVDLSNKIKQQTKRAKRLFESDRAVAQPISRPLGMLGSAQSSLSIQFRPCHWALEFFQMLTYVDIFQHSKRLQISSWVHFGPQFLSAFFRPSFPLSHRSFVSFIALHQLRKRRMPTRNSALGLDLTVARAQHRPTWSTIWIHLSHFESQWRIWVIKQSGHRWTTHVHAALHQTYWRFGFDTLCQLDHCALPRPTHRDAMLTNVIKCHQLRVEVLLESFRCARNIDMIWHDYWSWYILTASIISIAELLTK
jgi:hypothetical protein